MQDANDKYTAHVAEEMTETEAECAAGGGLLDTLYKLGKMRENEIREQIQSGTNTSP